MNFLQFFRKPDNKKKPATPPPREFQATCTLSSRELHLLIAGLTEIADLPLGTRINSEEALALRGQLIAARAKLRELEGLCAKCGDRPAAES